MVSDQSLHKDGDLQKKIARVCDKAEILRLDPLIEARFLRYVDKTENCWKWTGGKSQAGYGNFRIRNSQIKPHRFSYAFYIGLIPKGLLVCHKCDNPACVNPAHLFLGDNQANMDDAKAKKRLASGKRNGRYTHPESIMYGQDNANSKLTEKDVIKMRRLYATGKFSKAQLGRKFKITDTMACFIINRKSWKHI